MQEKLVKCNSCYFFVLRADSEFSGNCFVNPPQLVKDKAGYYSRRPIVDIGDLGCSKYHRKSFKSEE